VTLVLEGIGWSAPRPGRFTPGKDPVPIVQEAGWASGLAWTCVKNCTPTGIRFPDRPVHTPSLYWLSYPAHYTDVFSTELGIRLSFVQTLEFWGGFLKPPTQTPLPPSVYLWVTENSNLTSGRLRKSIHSPVTHTSLYFLHRCLKSEM
jgi:hypothetical protein